MQFTEGIGTEFKCKLSHNPEKYDKEFNGIYITIKLNNINRFAN